MIREQRLKNIRAAAQVTRPAPITRPQLVRPVPRKTRPVQAQGVAGRHKRARARNPILAERIERAFEGKTAVLFATGPSLTPEVVDEIMDARLRQELYLFGCNDAYRIVPYLNVHYACDFAWWRKHFQQMKDYETTHGMWTQEPNMSQDEFPGLRRIAGSGGRGLSVSQDLIHFGNNSGYQLINLAFLFGIRNFILCGYNMQVIDKQKHFFGDHPQGLNRSGGYTGFVGQYRTIKPEQYGIEIINATPDSALDAFPKMDLTNALRRFQ